MLCVHCIDILTKKMKPAKHLNTDMFSVEQFHNNRHDYLNESCQFGVRPLSHNLRRRVRHSNTNSHEMPRCYSAGDFKAYLISQLMSKTQSNDTNMAHSKQ